MEVVCYLHLSDLSGAQVEVLGAGIGNGISLQGKKVGGALFNSLNWNFTIWHAFLRPLNTSFLSTAQALESHCLCSYSSILS